MVVYGGGGLRGKQGAWSGGVTSNSLLGTCPGDRDSTSFHCGRVSAVPLLTSPPLINLDEFSAEYSSRVFKPFANCN